MDSFNESSKKQPVGNKEMQPSFWKFQQCLH